MARSNNRSITPRKPVSSPTGSSNGAIPHRGLGMARGGSTLAAPHGGEGAGGGEQRLGQRPLPRPAVAYKGDVADSRRGYRCHLHLISCQTTGPPGPSARQPTDASWY